MNIAGLIKKQMDVVSSFQDQALNVGDMESMKGLEIAIDKLKILQDIENPRADFARATTSTELSSEVDSHLRQIVQEELAKAISQEMYSISSM